MFCCNCGNQLVPNTLFCSKCGVAVNVEQMQPTTSSVPQQMGCIYKEKREVDTLSLVLSIVSLAGPFVMPITAPITLGCAIAGLVVARRRRETKNVTAATVMSIIGIVISAMMLIGIALLIGLSMAMPYMYVYE